MYCMTCNETICFECTISGHRGHEFERASKALGGQKAALAVMLGLVRAQGIAMDKTLEAVRARERELSELKFSLEGDVRGATAELRGALDQREAGLLRQLDREAGRKAKVLSSERDEKERVRAQIASAAERTGDALRTLSDLDLLHAKKALTRQMQEVLSLMRETPDVLKVSTEADISFCFTEREAADLREQLHRFGGVATPSSLDPQRCVVRGRGLEEASFEDETTSVQLEVFNHRGRPFVSAIPEGDVISSFTFLATGQKRTCDICHRRGNFYDITYSPVQRGIYELRIAVEEVEVRGSPFRVLVRLPVERLGAGGVTDVLEEMEQPWGVAVSDRRGEVVVTECNPSKLTVFEATTGKKIRSISSPGELKGQIKYPRGVALDNEEGAGEGNVFVVDAGNYRVQKFDASGRFLVAAGTRGRGPGQFEDPKGIAFNPITKNIYVADTHRVQIMTSDLAFLKSFGRPEGQFGNVFSVACDSKHGDVYVCDKDHKTVQLFTANGQFKRSLLGGGPAPTRLLGRLWGGQGGKADVVPVGVAVDACGYVYVSDNACNRVSVFSDNGACLVTFGRDGCFSGEFKSPRGIAATEAGVVYVCDFGNDRIQVF